MDNRICVIYDNIRKLNKKMDTFDYANASPLECFGLIHYTQNYFKEQKRACEWIIYEPYLEKLYIYALSHFDFVSGEELMNCKNTYFGEERENQSFFGYLVHLTRYYVEKYNTLIEPEITEFNRLKELGIRNKELCEEIKNMSLFVFSLDFVSIMKYIIISDYLDNIFCFLSITYSEFITKSEMEVIFENLKIDKKENIILINIQEKLIKNIKNKINSDDSLSESEKEKYNNLIKNIDIINLVENYINKEFTTPDNMLKNNKEFFDLYFLRFFLYFDEHKEKLENFHSVFKLLKIIEDKLILDTKTRVDSGEDLDIVFSELSQKAIIDNKLNVTPFSEKLFTEIFKSKIGIIYNLCMKEEMLDKINSLPNMNGIFQKLKKDFEGK